jgi:hypothetical protein
MSKLRGFKVLAGVHHHNVPGEMKAKTNADVDPNVYAVGSVVKTRVDLKAAFPNKFEEIQVEQPAPPAPAAAVVKTPAAVTTPPKAETSAPDAGEGTTMPAGEDATDQFPKAKKLGFVVTKTDEGYFVADKDNPTRAANAKAIKKSEVEQYVADLA